MTHNEIIAKELGITLRQVENTVFLLDSGATIPFIARYRKELTGMLDEVAITAIRDRLAKLRDLDKRRESILASVKEQGLLTDDLEQKFLAAANLSELEDLYLPYKPKRKTRATIARSKGLEPLATMIFAQGNQDPAREAAKYTDPGKGVEDAGEALAGARDIIAEWISEDSSVRSALRNLFMREARLTSSVVKGKEIEGRNYEQYYDFGEPVSKSPSHRILAMLRGENEGFLRICLEPDSENALVVIRRLIIRNAGPCSAEVDKALTDAYKRLLQPSMETEIRQYFKQKADTEAIRVFAENARQLLLAPPLGQKTVLAIDPGFRTGCKLVILDPQGNLLHNETIYPHPPENQIKEAIHKIESLADAYKIEAIAIGNGTAGRETENLIRRIRFKRDVQAIVVNESGASVYSASAVAREEFPDYDITVRGAVSIGRRLLDPLAELVKIDPKSIGVGQYQHDVNQSQLQQSLEDTVVSCVNSVGVELNTASKELLSYVSGLGPVLAGNIVGYRKANGPFKSRNDLRKVPRFGEKAFEQAAGFLRIRNGEHPLDASAVHPESYDIVNKMAASLGCGIADLIGGESLRKQINLREFVTDKAGMPTLTDIMAELARPGRDPRQKFDFFAFAEDVHQVEDLKPGMILPGIVTNITAFGAFVDVGVHQDGLVHISQIANRYISNPNEVLKLNQKVQVKVLSVDTDRKRIQLSMKEADQKL